MSSLKVVAEFTNRTQAEISKTALDARGIHAVVQGDDLGGLGPGQSFIGRVQVLVNEDDYETAVQLLAKE
jgi:hypothetical protein